MLRQPENDHECVVKLPPTLNDRRRAELVELARYCAARVDRQLAGVDQWEVSVVSSAGQAVAVVRARRLGARVEARAHGAELADAVWNAMCRVEQRLREAPWSSGVDWLEPASMLAS